MLLTPSILIQNSTLNTQKTMTIKDKLHVVFTTSQVPASDVVLGRLMASLFGYISHPRKIAWTLVVVMVSSCACEKRSLDLIARQSVTFAVGS
jgi:hypothetical protein